jgi:hypothetical protein
MTTDEDSTELFEDTPTWTQKDKAQGILALNGVLFGAWAMVVYSGMITGQLVLGANAPFVIAWVFQIIITGALAVNIIRYWEAGDFE